MLAKDVKVFCWGGIWDTWWMEPYMWLSLLYNIWVHCKDHRCMYENVVFHALFSGSNIWRKHLFALTFSYYIFTWCSVAVSLSYSDFHCCRIYRYYYTFEDYSVILTMLSSFLSFWSVRCVKIFMFLEILYISLCIWCCCISIGSFVCFFWYISFLWTGFCC